MVRIKNKPVILSLFCQRMTENKGFAIIHGLLKTEVIMKKLLLLCLLFAANGFAYVSQIWPGVYQLSGANSAWSDHSYQGEVVIEPQGENYRLTWFIGSHQAQVGVGILDGHILSVAFCDAKNGSWGTVAFRVVGNGELEGRWATLNGTTQGLEYLVWKGY